MADKLERPEEEIKVTGREEPIRMTYVIFNDILRFVGTPDEAIASIMTSQDTRDLILRRLLSNYKKPIEDSKDLIPVEEMGISIYEIDDVLAWVIEHVTYFFMSQAEKLQKRMKKYPEQAKKMMSSDRSETGTPV